MRRMTPPAFDPARYPRTYRASTGWRAFWLLVGGGSGAGGLAMLVDDLLLRPVGDPERALSHGVGWLLMALLGLAMLAGVLRSRLVIGPDFIEARSFGTWRLPRADIADYRVHVHHGMREFRLRSKGRRRPFTFTQVFKADDAFAAWFAGLVDSDALLHGVALQRVAGDETLGATAGIRLERVDGARRAVRWLLVPAYAIAFWTLASPEPGALVLALTAIQPIVALFLTWRFQGLFTLAGSRRPVRADLGVLLLVPGVALAGRALQDASLAQPASLLAPALAVGAGLWALALASSDDLRAARLQAIGMAVVLVLYAGGLLALADVRLDQAAPVRTAATVTAKRMTSGKGASARLTLAGSPGHPEAVERRVPRPLYRRVAVGDLVCVTDHPGAFGWHWSSIDGPDTCTAR